MKIGLLVDLVHGAHRRLRNESPRIGEGLRKVAGKVIIAPTEQVQLHQSQTPREALDTLAQPSRADLLLLGVVRPAEQVPLLC